MVRTTSWRGHAEQSPSQLVMSEPFDKHFIVDASGKQVAVILPIAEYERLLGGSDGPPADIDRARVLANHIESLHDFAFVTLDAPYHHMGATLVDGVFQAGVRYETVVVPRVERVRREHPEAVTTSAFAALLSGTEPHELLDWTGDRQITTLLTLTHLLIDHGVENESELLAWLDRPGSEARVTAIKGIKDKTFQYLRLLAGAEDAVAVDRWMWRVLDDAGVSASDFDEAHELIGAAAMLLDVTPSTLEHSLWSYMSQQ